MRPTRRRQALLAVPGPLETPTGGYGYARRLLEEAHGAGLALRHWPLPDGFPDAPRETIDEAANRLAMAPSGWPIVADGLALGVLPPDAIRGAACPVIALCHHPLGFESGLTQAEAERLIASERAALAACAGVVTTSHTTARLLRTELAVPEERIAVAQPGTDRVPTRLHLTRADRTGPVILLAVGSLTPRKGHDVLLSALGKLADLDWRLTVVGQPRDAAHARMLELDATLPGLKGRVRLAGEVDQATLGSLYREAEIFALASRFEGYGMAYTEAMAHGLPVVGCDVGAVAEATGGAAILVPPNDPGALADALRPLIANRQVRHKAAEAAQAAACGLPTWSDTAAAVRDAVAVFAPDGH